MTGPAAELFAEHYPTVQRYVELLATRGLEWGLIGPREVDRLWDRHVLNSVALHELLPTGASVADVGSGAGLPGIPLSLLRPDLQVTLIEPLLRRSTFLTQAVDELGITGRVRVSRSRAEDHRETYDAVVSRALAPLPRLVTWCNPLRDAAGAILALKGRSAADEIRGASQLLSAHRLSASVLSVRAHPAAEPTSVIRVVAA